MKKLIIAGGTGFLGQACIDYFTSKFDTIVVLTRKTQSSTGMIEYVSWDAKTLGPWQEYFNDADVLINMTGRSVDCRYTDANKKVILDSRVDSTRILGEAIRLSQNPPKVWLNSSTATIYRDSLDMEMGEKHGEIGTGFSVSVAKAWEQAFFSQETPSTRKVALRTSIVLGKNGGALTPIKNLAKIGFGGKQGPGNQKFSWIHVSDFVQSIDFIIKHPEMEGPVNLVAPTPTTNVALMQTVRKTIGIPFGIPMHKFLLEIGARVIQTETELILKSRNVIPVKLQEAGFKFEYATLESALKEAI